MGIHPLKKIEDKVRDLVQNLDYLLYLLLNPFKFKPYPKIINKILIVELFNIGDLIVITPVLKALKQVYPKAEIDVLIKKGMESVLAHNKNVNNLIPFTAFSEMHSLIKKRNYDLGMILHPGSLQISLLLLLGKVKYRVGCTKAGITYGKGFFLNKKVFPNNKWQHKIEDNLDVIRSIHMTPTDKSLELHTAKTAEQKMAKLLNKKQHPWIGITAASKHWTQQWYPDKFAEVANYYINRKNAAIIFTGLKTEQEQIDDIISRITKKENVFNLCGKTTFPELVAVIKQLDLLITIDSASTHIASAFNTPVLTLFGPTMPPFWGPTGKNSSFIWKEKEACIGCRRYYCIYRKDHECMKSITPEEVVTTSEKIMKRKKERN